MEQQNQNGYSKKSIWKWIIIYVVIGVLVYAAVYYFFFYNNQQSFYSNTTQYQNQQNQQQPNIQQNAQQNMQQNLSAKTVSVTIKSFAFSPAQITVNKGDTIIWTNNDTAPHTVTGDNGGPNSSNLQQGATYSYTFTNTGTFSYHCAIHPNMKGTVTVK